MAMTHDDLITLLSTTPSPFEPTVLLESIALTDIESFFSELKTALLPDDSDFVISDLWPEEFFPGFSALKNITIDFLAFGIEESTVTKTLIFDLSWNGKIVLIEDVFEVDTFSITVSVINQSISAHLNGIIEFEGYNFTLEVELPSMITKLKLINSTDQSTMPSPLNFLQRYGAHPDQQAASSEVLDTHPGITLSDLAILVHPRAKRFIGHLAIDNLHVGSAILDTQFQIEYTAGNISGALWSIFEINNNIAIPLYAEHSDLVEGWQLEGGIALGNVNLATLFSGIIKKLDVTGDLHPAIADHNQGVFVEYIFMSVNTATKEYTFSCSLDFHHFFGTSDQPLPKHKNAKAEDEVELTINIHVGRSPTNPTVKQVSFSGQLIFHINDLALEFDFVFGKDKHDKTLIAAYKNLSGGSVNVMRIIHQLNDHIPDLDIEVDLEQAYFIFSKQTASTDTTTPTDHKSNYLFGAKIKAAADLSAMPLVGEKLSGTLGFRASLQPFYASTDFFTKDKLSEFQAMLPGQGLSLPNKDLKKGADLDVILYMGADPMHLGLPILPADLKSKNTSSENGGTSPTANVKSTTGDAVTDGDNTKWFDVKKTLSIFYIERIGIRFDEPKFWIQVDGSLTASGLTLSLDGLGIGFSIPDMTPSFALHGIGLDYSKNSIEIGGAFLRQTVSNDQGTYDEYDGMAVIKTEKIRLSALGSYARLNGETSLFVFAFLNANLGGPAFFFVTGLAAGFGYNRKVVMPKKATEVSTFPLMVAAIKDNTPPKDTSKRGNYLSKVLSDLNRVVPVELGEYFLAVGVQFNSFKLVDTFALLSVSFGVKLEFDLIGLSTLIVPKKVGNDKSEPLAIIQLAVIASYHPDTGLLDVHGNLTDKSYVLSSKCHLRGAFLFRSWFKGDHAGDFVLSIGGYHRNFRVPAHYGAAPARLGFDWQVSDELALTGNLYAALTAHAVMAGGSFRATYTSSVFDAHFGVGADILISWKPYHYEFGIWVGVGAHIPLFGGFDVSAEVNIWGPEFSGHADVDLTIGTYPVDFGNDKPKLQRLNWDQFHKSFIPEPEKVCTINIINGLLQTVMIPDPEDHRKPGTPHHFVNPKTFSLEINSLVPISTISPDNGDQISSVVKFGAAPMGRGIGSVTSAMTITVPENINIKNKKTDSSEMPILIPTSLTKKMPAAIWGGSLKPGVNSSRFIEDALTGLSLSPDVAIRSDQTSPAIERSKLKFELSTRANAFEFDDFSRFSKSGQITNDSSELQIGTIAQTAIQSAFLELGFQSEEFQIDFRNSLVRAFVEAPTLGSLNIL